MSPARRKKRRATRARILWTDVELRVAVEAYLYLARLERSGFDYTETDLTKFLVGGPLKHRDTPSIRYRMRNISFVLRERGWKPLRRYSPAPRVGAGVRLRIERILDSQTDAEFSVLRKAANERARSRGNAAVAEAREEATRRLATLEDALRDLQAELAGIGHNNPPEGIDEVPLLSGDVQDAIADAQAIREELTTPDPEPAKIEPPTRRLIDFGLKVATWIGERVTKFTDAALVSLAPIAIAKATNLMPLIIDALEALGRAVGHK